MKRVSLSLFTVVLAATMTGADAVVELPPAEGVTEWVAGGTDLATNPLSIDLTNQQALTFEKSSLTLKEMSPGSNLTDIGLSGRYRVTAHSLFRSVLAKQLLQMATLHQTILPLPKLIRMRSAKRCLENMMNSPQPSRSLLKI